MEEFTHIDKLGRVRMVDVTDKKPSERIAVAQGVVSMKGLGAPNIISFLSY
ncbi:MAG: hypothetical protein V3S72_01285 [Desulfobacterales bacterium]